MKLYESQRNVVDKITELSSYHDAVFFQAPPGWGKTAVLVALANRYRREGRKVIIATVRNDLVSQFLDTVRRLDDDSSCEATAVVGRRNYLLLDKAVSAMEKNEAARSMIGFKEVVSFLKKERSLGKKFLFVSDVQREYSGITDTDAWEMATILGAPESGDEKKEIPLLEDTDYVVTNVFYLVSRVVSSGSEAGLPEGAVVLLDEADYFADNVREFFSGGFSLHGFFVRNRYKYVQTQLEEFDRLAKGAEKARRKASRLASSFARGKREDVMWELYDILVKSIPKRLLRFAASCGDDEIERQAGEMIRFLRDADRLGAGALIRTGIYGLNFSPVRRYPSVVRRSSRGEAKALLERIWEYMVSGGRAVIGAGATIVPGFTPDRRRSAVKKEMAEVLGLPPSFDGVFLPVEDIVRLKPRNISVFLSAPDAPRFTYGSSRAMDEMTEYIANVVEKTYTGGRAMVLCMSRDLSEYIAEKIARRGIETVWDESACIRKTLAGFFAKKECVLVSHSGLGIGMDVPELSKLYIAQLPFGYARSLRAAERDFVQWTGRLREDRSGKETRELYILDSRIVRDAGNKTRNMLSYLRYAFAEILEITAGPGGAFFYNPIVARKRDGSIYAG